MKDFMKNNTNTLNQNNNRSQTQLEGIERRITGVVDRLEALEIRLPPANQDQDHVEQARCVEEDRRRLHDEED